MVDNTPIDGHNVVGAVIKNQEGGIILDNFLRYLVEDGFVPTLRRLITTPLRFYKKDPVDLIDPLDGAYYLSSKEDIGILKGVFSEIIEGIKEDALLDEFAHLLYCLLYFSDILPDKNSYGLLSRANGADEIKRYCNEKGYALQWISKYAIRTIVCVIWAPNMRILPPELEKFKKDLLLPLYPLEPPLPKQDLEMAVRALVGRCEYGYIKEPIIFIGDDDRGREQQQQQQGDGGSVTEYMQHHSIFEIFFKAMMPITDFYERYSLKSTPKKYNAIMATNDEGNYVLRSVSFFDTICCRTVQHRAFLRWGWLVPALDTLRHLKMLDQLFPMVTGSIDNVIEQEAVMIAYTSAQLWIVYNMFKQNAVRYNIATDRTIWVLQRNAFIEDIVIAFIPGFIRWYLNPITTNENAFLTLVNFFTVIGKKSLLLYDNLDDMNNIRNKAEALLQESIRLIHETIRNIAPFLLFALPVYIPNPSIRDIGWIIKNLWGCFCHRRKGKVGDETSLPKRGKRSRSVDTGTPSTKNTKKPQKSTDYTSSLKVGGRKACVAMLETVTCLFIASIANFTPSNTAPGLLSLAASTISNSTVTALDNLQSSLLPPEKLTPVQKIGLEAIRNVTIEKSNFITKLIKEGYTSDAQRQNCFISCSDLDIPGLSAFNKTSAECATCKQTFFNPIRANVSITTEFKSIMQWAKGTNVQEIVPFLKHPRSNETVTPPGTLITIRALFDELHKSPPPPDILDTLEDFLRLFYEIAQSSKDENLTIRGNGDDDNDSWLLVKVFKGLRNVSVRMLNPKDRFLDRKRKPAEIYKRFNSYKAIIWLASLSMAGYESNLYISNRELINPYDYNNNQWNPTRGATLPHYTQEMTTLKQSRMRGNETPSSISLATPLAFVLIPSLLRARMTYLTSTNIQTLLLETSSFIIPRIRIEPLFRFCEVLVVLATDVFYLAKQQLMFGLTNKQTVIVASSPALGWMLDFVNYGTFIDHIGSKAGNGLQYAGWMRNLETLIALGGYSFAFGSIIFTIGKLYTYVTGSLSEDGTIRKLLFPGSIGEGGGQFYKDFTLWEMLCCGGVLYMTHMYIETTNPTFTMSDDQFNRLADIMTPKDFLTTTDNNIAHFQRIMDKIPLLLYDGANFYVDSVRFRFLFRQYFRFMVYMIEEYTHGEYFRPQYR